MSNFREKLKDIKDEHLLEELVERHQVGMVYKRNAIHSITFDGMDMPERGRSQSDREVEFVFDEKTGKLIHINLS